MQQEILLPVHLQPRQGTYRIPQILHPQKARRPQFSQPLSTVQTLRFLPFTGEVTEIGNTASVSGGVAKYTVSVSVPKDEQMKQGMNASATVTIENRENVITIPVNALQEKGDRVFVYTSTDEEGNLSGETEVKTGLSDGTTVEITDGFLKVTLFIIPKQEM